MPHYMLLRWSSSPHSYAPFYILVSVILAVSARKLFLSLHDRGLKTTFTLLGIRIKAAVELLLPPVIWGERVGLRSIKTSLTDAQIERAYSWLCDEDILRWTGGAPIDRSLEEFRLHMRHDRWHPQLNQRIFYIVTHSNELVGRVGLFTIDWTKGEAEIGLMIDKRHWGNHYGSEAVSLFLKYVFSETPLDRIYLGTFGENKGAQRIARDSGFRLTGPLRRYNPIIGEYMDGIAMEITREEYRHRGTTPVNDEAVPGR